MEKSRVLLLTYTALMAVFLICTLVPGIWVTDEGTYALMAKAFAVDGQFHLWNGFDEIVSHELRIQATEISTNGVEVRIYPMSAPLYPLLAYPFYSALGLYGLHLMNVLSFVILIVLVYEASNLLFKDGLLAFFSAVLYSAGTYSLQYSQMLWPQMVSVLLVFSSMYLLLRNFVGKSGSVSVFFLAGLLSGLAVGVRYPNGGFTVLFAIFTYVSMRDGLKPFLTGALLPLSALAYLNFTFFGSFLESGYGSYNNFSESFFVLAFIALSAALALAWGLRKGLTREVVAGRWRLLVIGASVLAIILLTLPPIRGAIIYFYSSVFDMVSNPFVSGLVLEKRAFFESTPYLLLAVLSPALLFRRKFPALLAVFFLFFCTMEMAYFSTRGGLGGDDETYGMRYFLEAVPLFTVLSAAVAFEIGKKVPKGTLVVSGLLLVVGIAFLLGEGHRVYPTGILRKLPVVLAALTVYTAWMGLTRKDYAQASCLFISLCIAFSVSAAYVDLTVLGSLRGGVYGTFRLLEPQIQNDSAIFYTQSGEAPYAEYVKLFKKVRMVGRYMDDGNDTGRLLQFYTSKGIPVYVNLLNPEGSQEILDIASEMNLTNVYFINFSLSQ